jgi:hypothetical protein
LQVARYTAVCESELQRVYVRLGTCPGVGYEGYLGRGFVLVLDGNLAEIASIRLQRYLADDSTLNMSISLGGRLHCWAEYPLATWMAPAWMNLDRWIRRLELQFPREVVSGCGQRCLVR